MSENQLFIPDKIRVGFQQRNDTYTKKLAYIIYYDQKGVIRKEKSWESWRDQKIDSVEFQNEPTEGFVLNKGVGGNRNSYGWNSRNEYIRVYDPRDFEFEISVSNLLFILRECDCSRGKGLEGKFVYSWQGTELVLLPVISQDFQNSKNYTKLQSCGIKAKDLIKGASYKTKKQEDFIYLGKLDRFHVVTLRNDRTLSSEGVEKKHVFWNGKDFVFFNDLKQFAILNSDTIVPNYAELVDDYYKSIYGSKVVKLFTKEIPPKPVENRYWNRECWYSKESENCYIECYTSFDYKDQSKVTGVTTLNKIYFKDGLLVCEQHHENLYLKGYLEKNPYYNHQWGRTSTKWIEPTNHRLYALMESGSEYKVSGSNLIKEE